MLSDCALNLGSFGAASKLSQRGDTPVGDAARDDKSEMAEVSPMVEREPVAGHPSRDSHPDSGKFFLTYPDSRQPVNSARVNAVICRDPNEHFLQVSNVTVHVASIGF